MVTGVRRQHLERCSNFLVKELMVVRGEDVEERVFFVSAKESLMRKNGDVERQTEFNRFKHCLLSSVASSAVLTKFTGHVETAIKICNQLVQFYRSIDSSSNSLLNQCLKKRQELSSSIQVTQAQMEPLTSSLRLQISKMLESIARRITIVYHEEVREYFQ